MATPLQRGCQLLPQIPGESIALGLAGRDEKGMRLFASPSHEVMARGFVLEW